MRKLYFVLIGVYALLLSSCQSNIKNIITEVKAASFTIYTYDEYGIPSGTGSGFFIDNKGTGITNYHVLDNSVKAKIVSYDGAEYEIDKVIQSDKNWDIVKFIIKGSHKKIPFLKFANKDVEMGDKVYNISSPLGLEQTVSEGIVSSIRKDSHGVVIQITAPISPGSSGSAIVNTKGEVIAVATFLINGGQNLNFGVSIDDYSVEQLKNKNNVFDKENSAFNKKDQFILINEPSMRDANVFLHALEFKQDVTIAYLSYTNLNMSMDDFYIWCELNIGDKGFTIENTSNKRSYFITASTLGDSKSNGTKVPLASNLKFKVYFPAIKEKLGVINVTYGKDSRGWQFNNINLDDCRNSLRYDSYEYLKLYAFAALHQGNLSESVEKFKSLLDINQDDMHALNALGIISFLMENYMDARHYFSKAINSRPDQSLGYINRAYMSAYQGQYKEALSDYNKAISIVPDHPDNYIYRAFIFMELKEWSKAIRDMDIVINSGDYKHDALAYYHRAMCFAQLRDKSNFRRDLQLAYKYSNDIDLKNEISSMLKGIGIDAKYLNNIYSPNKNKKVSSKTSQSEKSDSMKPIEDKNSNISISRENLSLGIGQREKLYVYNYGESVKWESDDPNIASISSDGWVTGISHGSTYLWARGSNRQLISCRVVVNKVYSSSSTSSSTSSNVRTIYTKNATIKVGQKVKANIIDGEITRWEISSTAKDKISVSGNILIAKKEVVEMPVWGYVGTTPKLFIITITK